MKAKELRIKSITELRELEKELKKKIQGLLIDKALNRLNKPHLLKLAKKDLARVLTIIKEKENQK